VPTVFFSKPKLKTLFCVAILRYKLNIGRKSQCEMQSSKKPKIETEYRCLSRKIIAMNRSEKISVNSKVNKVEGCNYHESEFLLVRPRGVIKCLKIDEKKSEGKFTRKLSVPPEPQ
jgi:hypothetical protein